MTTTINTDGQVTIPKPLLDLLGLAPGSSVEVLLNDRGEIVLIPAGSPQKSKFSHLLGHAGEGLSTDEIMAMTRGED